jgi:hypothetical protein
MTRKRRVQILAGRASLGVVIGCLGLTACDSGGSGPGMPTKDPTPAEPSPIAINVAANDAVVKSPFDATPSPDGKTVYYTALRDESGERVPGIFKVPAAGGDIEVLATGEPLSAPVGISVSFDGLTLFIADPGAAGGGAILTVSTSGGTASKLGGTEGFYPGGLVVAKTEGPNGTPALWFTGRDPASGARGVFTVALSGGAPSPVATGAPFAEPGGVAVAKDGRIFVADALASDGLSALVKVEAGEATRFVESIGVGFPAGIILTHDESTVIVSGLDPVTRRDVVYFVNAATKEVTTMTDTVGAFHEPAGLHRAHDTNVFAWADSQANETGTVYVLKP